MSAFLASPLVGWMLLAVLALEAVGLLMVWKFTNRGLPPMQVATFLGAGASFAIALLVVLAAGPPVLFALALVAAFIFHTLDLWQRWR